MSSSDYLGISAEMAGGRWQTSYTQEKESLASNPAIMAAALAKGGSSTDFSALMAGESADFALPKRRDLEDVIFTPKRVTEMGQTGIWRDQNGLPVYDPNPAMRPYRARGLALNHGDLHKIFFYDPVVSGVFSLMLAEVLRADWSATNYRNESPIERKKRKLLEVVLGLVTPEGGQEWGIMGGGLRRLVFHLFWANLYGFSLNEEIWDYVTIDGEKFLVPVDCRYRAPWSIYRWIYSHDRLVGCTQIVAADEGFNLPKKDPFLLGRLTGTPRGFIERVIPLDKCLLRSNRAVDGNPEGISDFRTAYIFVKAKIEAVIRNQISEDRLANGIILVEEQGNDFGPYRSVGQKDKESLARMIMAFSKGLTNRIVVPFGVNLKFMWPTYDRPDNIQYLEWLDKQIMLGSTSSLLGLDATRAASRGLNDSLAMLAFHAIENAADDIANVINGVPGREGTGLVQKIFQANGLFRKGRPVRVEHFGISHQDAQRLIESMSKANQMIVTATDGHDEIKLRRAARLPTSDIESVEEARAKVVQQNGQLVSQGPQQKIVQPNQAENKQRDGNDNPTE